MKILKKIPMITVAIVIGVLSVSLTAYAYFSFSMQAKVANIQVADYAIKVTPVLNSTENNNDYVSSVKGATSIAFTDLGIVETEETDVSFRLTATGSTTARGYCMILVGDGTYYTKPIDIGQDYIVVIQGNKDTVVNLNACWGNLDTAGVEIIGDYVTQDTQETEPSTEPNTEPGEETSTEASMVPDEEVSTETSMEPSEIPIQVN